jgi:hypothetical protein
LSLGTAAYAQVPRPHENAASKVRSAVVAVRGTGSTEEVDSARALLISSERSWSGLIIDSIGRVLTVAHALDTETTVWVQMIANSSVMGRRYRLRAMSATLDLALLEPITAFIHAPPFMSLYGKARARRNGRVLGWGAIPPLIDSGIVTMVRGVLVTPDSTVKTDSAQRHVAFARLSTTTGFSGGPLTDNQGRVLGILRSRMVAGRDIDFAMAIPVDIVRQWLAMLANEERPDGMDSFTELSAVAPPSQGIGLLLAAAAPDTISKKTTKNFVPIAVAVIVLAYLWQHLTRSSTTKPPTAKAPGGGCTAVRLEPVAGLNPRSEADRERLALFFESSGTAEFRSAENSHDEEAIELAIVHLETARTFLVQGPRWCAATFRLARLYAWRGQGCLSSTVFLDELKRSSVPACAQLARILVQSQF